MGYEAFKELLFTTIQSAGVRVSKIGEVMGYTGDTSDMSSAAGRILNHSQALTVEQLILLSNFFRYPVGYFLLGDEESSLKEIDTSLVIENVKKAFEEANTIKQGNKKPKPKYALGKLLGDGKSHKAYLKTMASFMNTKRKMKVRELFIIADFFEKPIEWFLQK